MNTTLLAISLFVSPLFLAAQEEVDTVVMRKIKEEESKHSQVEKLAHYLTDVCGPRLTNAPGYNRAVKWTVRTLKQWGVRNAAPEPWGEFGKGWSNEESYLAMRQPYYQPLIAYPSAWTNSTPGFISGPVVLLDNLDSASIDKLGAAIKGSIVMVKSSDTIRSPFKADAWRYEDSMLNKLPGDVMPTYEWTKSLVKYFRNKYNVEQYLQAKGAVAELTMMSESIGDGTVVAWGPNLAYRREAKPTLPTMFVAIEHYLTLQRLLLSGQPVTVDMKIRNRWYSDDLTGYNVIAEIPGTDPTLKKQVVMLGAHLDSWHSGTGATDNAAGCIATMEAIRILQELEIKPRRTIRLALWGGEEQGHLGSYGYVKKHFGNPRDMKLSAEQANISAYFNLDNGTGRIRGVYLQNNEGVRDIFAAWLKPFHDMGATGLAGSNTGFTDHMSFDAIGIPAFQFIQDHMDLETRTHHTNMDVYDHLSIGDLKQAATILAAFVYNTAMRDQMLPRKPLPKPEPFGLELFQHGLLK